MVHPKFGSNCRCTSYLESSPYKTEDHAIDYCIQATCETFLSLSPMEHLPNLLTNKLITLTM